MRICTRSDSSEATCALPQPGEGTPECVGSARLEFALPVVSGRVQFILSFQDSASYLGVYPVHKVGEGGGGYNIL